AITETSAGALRFTQVGALDGAHGSSQTITLKHTGAGGIIADDSSDLAGDAGSPDNYNIIATAGPIAINVDITGSPSDARSNLLLQGVGITGGNLLLAARAGFGEAGSNLSLISTGSGNISVGN